MSVKQATEELDKLQASFRNAKTEDGGNFYAAARKWMIETGIMTDHDYNDIVILTHMVDAGIKNTEFYIDRNTKKVHQIVYLSRFAYLFRNRETLEAKIVDSIGHLIKDYEYELRVELFRYKKQN